MKKQFIVKCFDGRKEKFLNDFNDKRVLTGNAHESTKFKDESLAEAAIEGVLMADEIADIIGKDLLRNEVLFTIVPVFIAAE